MNYRRFYRKPKHGQRRSPGLTKREADAISAGEEPWRDPGYAVGDNRQAAPIHQPVAGQAKYHTSARRPSV
jgi:hypothetical protein